jgi:hypothetical protein
VNNYIANDCKCMYSKCHLSEMDLCFAYLPDTAPRGIRSPSKTTAGTCFAGSFSGQTRMTSMMLLVMPQRMSRIAGCPSIRTYQNQISTPFNTCALQSERSFHLQARSPRHQPQYHLTSAKNWGWPIPEKFPLYPCQRRKVSCPTWNGSRSKADRGCSSGNLNILSTYLFFIPISLLVYEYLFNLFTHSSFIHDKYR